MKTFNKSRLPICGSGLKKLVVVALSLVSFSIAKADDSFAKKCQDLKENIKTTAKTKAVIISAQGTKAAIVGAALSGYQAAKCPAISIEEVNEILNGISN